MNVNKILLFIVINLLTNYCYGQLTDNFTDGDFTVNPPWSGHTDKFAVTMGKLKLQGPAVSESAFLTTPSSAIHNGSWEFYLQMDFAPSSTNYAKIYLTSDQSNLADPLNGYFIKAGNTSRDICLYRQAGSVETRIIDGIDDRINLSSVKVKIKVTRNDIGDWQLLSDVGVTGTYLAEGSVNDVNVTSSSFFGVQCIYTATRSDKFWFDDFVIRGVPVPDTTPPFIKEATALNSTQLNLLFSETLDQRSAENNRNYALADGSHPASAVLQPDQRTVQLTLLKPMVNGVSFPLTLSNIGDLAENISNMTIAVLYFQRVQTKNKDVILTEIFPDPSPQIGMPVAEFIEVFNRSENPFDLAGWKLSDGSSTAIFPTQLILPGEYWIVTANTSLNLFALYGKTIGIINFPTLNNDADKLTLKDSKGVLVDSVSYTTEWYRDTDKAQGGWTIELIDPANPCGEEDNWIASEDLKGGTPGRQNSVFANKPDINAPLLLHVFPDQSARLSLMFNEKLNTSSLAIGNFDITPAAVITTASFADNSLRAIDLDLQQTLVARQTYKIEIKDVRDCNGNVMTTTSFEFGLPEKAVPRDVVINEILFNPRSGGVDFVEIYNSSSKYLNLRDWKLANMEGEIPANIVSLPARNFLLPPNDFIVFTSDPEILKTQYTRIDETKFFKTTLPGLPDDAGSIVLMNEDAEALDELSYFKEMHSQFIKDDEGVSLERIAVSADTNDRNNWTSASSMTDFASPGLVNSQRRGEAVVSPGEVTVIPEIFSPGSGDKDFAQIQYRFDQVGSVGNVKVYDQQGHLLKTIANNEILGTEGFFRWDGDRDDSNKARSGYYIVWFETFDASGAVKNFRRRVVVMSN